MIPPLLIWTAFLFLPGWFLAHILKNFSKDEGLADRLAYSTALSSAIIILVFLSRSLFPWPMADGLGIMAIITAVIAISSISLPGFAASDFKRLLPPLPSRSELVVLAVSFAYLPFLIIIYLSKFPIFSAFYPSSEDYLNTANLVGAYAANPNAPPLPAQALYYGVHYHLAFLLNLFGPGANPLLVTREGMGVLAAVSSLYVYLAAKKILGSGSAGLVAVLIYSLTGFYWFGQVYNAGLYPNFYGAAMASLFLIVTARDFLSKEAGGKGLVLLLLLALLNALMGHYSDILLFPALALIGWFASRDAATRKRRLFFVGILIAPLVLGAVLFYNMFIGFAFNSSGFIPSLSGSLLSQAYAFFPSLSYSFLLINDDVASAILMAFAVLAGVAAAFDSKDRWGVLPVVWYSFVLLVAPLGASAWRFSFVALLPFVLLASNGFHHVAQNLTSRFGGLEMVKVGRKMKPRHSVISVALVSFLVVPILYSGWSSNVVSYSSGDCKNLNVSQVCYSQTDYSVYSAMQWLGAHRACYFNTTMTAQAAHRGDFYIYNYTMRIYPKADCQYVTPTDFRFTETRLVSGVPVVFEPSIVTSPLSAVLYAREHNMSYMVVDDLPEYSLPECYSIAPQLDILNSTAGHALKVRLVLLDAKGIARYNSSATIFVNGTKYADTYFTNGQVQGVLDFKGAGTYNITAEAGIVYSNTQVVKMGTVDKPVNHPADFFACRPDHWTSRDLGGAVLVYRNADVKIWCLPDVQADCGG